MPWGWDDNTNSTAWTDDPRGYGAGTGNGGGTYGGGNPASGGGTGRTDGLTTPTSPTVDPNSSSTFGWGTSPSPSVGSSPSSAWGNVGGAPSYSSGTPGLPGAFNLNLPSDVSSAPASGGGSSTPSGSTPGAPLSNNSYWNPYSNQWQSSAPPTSAPGFASTTNTAGPGGTSFVPTYLQNQMVTGPSANGSQALLQGQNTSSQAQNPQYYASQQTAQQLAQMLGGTAFLNSNGYSPDGTAGGGSPFSFANAWMIRLPDGRVVNAGQESQPWANGSANSDTIGNILRGGATLQQQQAMMPLSPSVHPGDFQQVGGPGNPLTYTPQALQAQGQQVAAQGTPQSYLQNLLGQQQIQQPAAPFDFGALISQLYGSNPFTAAFGNYGGQAAQSAGTNGTSMSDIASILNALFASRQQTSNSALSPLFWGSGYGTPQSSYYPTFQ